MKVSRPQLVLMLQGICPNCGAKDDFHSARVGNEEAIHCTDCDWVATYESLCEENIDH